MHTPWGEAQTIDIIAERIFEVTTASHGGIMLDEKRRAAMLAYMRNASFAGPSAYEEDCDWCMPALVFEKEFRAFYKHKNIKEIDGIFTLVKNTLRLWHPDVCEAFFGVILKPGESAKRDKQQFNRGNTNN